MGGFLIKVKKENPTEPKGKSHDYSKRRLKGSNQLYAGQTRKGYDRRGRDKGVIQGLLHVLWG